MDTSNQLQFKSRSTTSFNTSISDLLSLHVNSLYSNDALTLIKMFADKQPQGRCTPIRELLRHHRLSIVVDITCLLRPKLISQLWSRLISTASILTTPPLASPDLTPLRPLIGIYETMMFGSTPSHAELVNLVDEIEDYVYSHARSQRKLVYTTLHKQVINTLKGH